MPRALDSDDLLMKPQQAYRNKRASPAQKESRCKLIRVVLHSAGVVNPIHYRAAKRGRAAFRASLLWAREGWKALDLSSEVVREGGGFRAA